MAHQQQGACAMDVDVDVEVDIDITKDTDTGIELSKRHFLLTVFDMKGAAQHINVGEFKANLNLRELLECEDCYTNEVLFETLLKKHRIGSHYWNPENAKYFDCHGIYRGKCADYTSLHIIFFSVKHPELLTQATIKENQSIINALNRNFMIMNSATGDSMIMEHEYQIGKFKNLHTVNLNTILEF